MSETLPKISIALATLNSEKTLRKSLDSIRKQTYPQNLIEILLIDGGSTDQTRKIASEYGCHILENPKVEPASAKRIGLCQCSGDYLLFLDSDEEIENPESIKSKIQLIKKHQTCTVVSSGYKTPDGANAVSHYLNEFGDPFSYFVYQQSLDYRFFAKSLSAKHKVDVEDSSVTIIDFSESRYLPLLELGQFASLIDMNYLRSEFEISNEQDLDPFLLPHLFYILIKRNPKLAIAKNDNIFHYSSIEMKAFKSKILWRVRNNLHHRNDISGQSGYLHRQSFDASPNHFRKYLFIFYVGCIFPLFLGTLNLMRTRKSIKYFIHFPLSIFTLKSIIVESLRYLLKRKPPMTSYGSDQVIRTK